MLIDLQQIFESTGESQNLETTIDKSDYELFGCYPFINPIAVKGLVANKADVVFLDVKVSFDFKLPCNRCLEDFIKSYDYSFHHILVNEPDKENDEYIALEAFKLDLDELIMSDILLNLPSKFLCKDDCKGLCEKCGANLNFTSCDCNDDNIDPRLSVLADLLK